MKDGKVIKVEGMKSHPHNHGLLCTKGAANRDYIYREDRLKYPLRRVGERGEGKFEPITWEEALTETAGRLSKIREEDGATYILNSRDLCMIDHMDDLLRVGLTSLKIEGRAKSAYYTAVVTGAYRHAIDAAAAGEPLSPVWRAEVDKVSHRHYSTGFYYGQPGQYVRSARYLRDWQIVAVVVSCAPDGRAVVSLRNKCAAGEALELVGPGVEPLPLTAAGMTLPDGSPLAEARPPQMPFCLRLPRQVPPLSILRRPAALSPREGAPG